MIDFYFAPDTCALATHIAMRDAGIEFRLRRVDFGADLARNAPQRTRGDEGDGEDVDRRAAREAAHQAYRAAGVLAEGGFPRSLDFAHVDVAQAEMIDGPGATVGLCRAFDGAPVG